MSKGISEDAQIHISIAFLIKAMVAVAIVVGSWYQAQMKFQNIETKLGDLQDKVTILQDKLMKEYGSYDVNLSDGSINWPENTPGIEKPKSNEK